MSTNQYDPDTRIPPKPIRRPERALPLGHAAAMADSSHLIRIR